MKFKCFTLKVLTMLGVKCYDKGVKDVPCPYSVIGEDTLPGGLKF